MLGWFKRKKVKKEKIASQEVQPIEKVDEIAVEPIFSEEEIEKDPEVPQETGSLGDDIALEPVDFEQPESTQEQEDPHEVKPAKPSETTKIQDESLLFDVSEPSEKVEHTEPTNLSQDSDIFDELENLGEVFNLDTISTLEETELVQEPEPQEETEPSASTEITEKVLPLSGSDLQESQELTEEKVSFDATGTAKEEETPIPPESSKETEETTSLQEPVLTEPAEEIDFLEDVEIYEEPTDAEDSPTLEDPVATKETDYSEADNLFKELISLEETEDFEEHTPPEKPEVAVETIPPAEPEISEEPISPEEPEFLEDVEIYEEPETPAQPAAQEPTAKPQEIQSTSFFRRLSDRLSRTRDSFVNQMDLLFLGKKEIDADLLDDLEELLITSDLGVSTTSDLIEHARRKIKRKELSDPQALKELFKEKIKSYIMESTEPAELVMPESGPFVIMVIGVNGVGKTTTIGKITHKFIQSGQSVLLVAADTFRAAAVSQLQIWGKRNDVQVVSGKEGIDPSSVAFDAMEIAKEKEYDVVLVDTAGRLHTQTNLMEELKKIKRVMGKRLDGAPHEILLVLDATTGQNGVSQAKLFNEAVGVSGLALTKLDGTAKGGIVANICKDLRIPIRFIGIGEQVEDLRDFDPDEFIEALFHDRESS